MIAPTDRVTREAVANHYDDLDHFYRQIWGEHIHHGLWPRGIETREAAVRELVEVVATNARIVPRSRVCDVGCGYGATARMLASERGADVTALTISNAQFRYATSLEKSGSDPVYMLCDWIENELPRDSFDAVIAIESSEHMADKRGFFAQAHRILREGGRLVICAWLADEGAPPFARRVLLEPICREGRMPGIGTEAEYKCFLDTAGFDLESFGDLTARVKKTWPVCVRRFFFHLCRHPRDLRFLFNKHSRNRVFALTILRIWLAYKTGSLRYGLFAAHKK